MRLLLAASLFILFTACSDDETPAPSDFTGTIWVGPTVTFSKAAGGDPELESNQDRISPSVWLTRGNEGGQIFNANLESEYDKNESPRGTRWARGTLASVESLEFKKFREAVIEPKTVVGQDLVLYLVEEDTYVSVKFTSWDQQKNGGFSYERSSEN